MKLTDFFKKRTDSSHHVTAGQGGKDQSKARENIKNLWQQMEQQGETEQSQQEGQEKTTSPGNDTGNHDQILAELEDKINALREQKMAEESAAMAALQEKRTAMENKIAQETRLETPQSTGDDVTNIRSGGVDNPEVISNPETLERSRSPEG